MISNIVKTIVLASIALPSIATVANAEYIYHCRDGGKFAKCNTQSSSVGYGFHSRTRGIETENSWFVNSSELSSLSPLSQLLVGERFESLKPFAQTCKTEADWISVFNKDYSIKTDGFTAERVSSVYPTSNKLHHEVKITLDDVSHKKNIYGETITNTKSVSCFFNEDDGMMLSNPLTADMDQYGNKLSNIVNLN